MLTICLLIMFLFLAQLLSHPDYSLINNTN